MPDRDPHQWQLLGFEELFEAWLAAEDLAGYGDLELIVWRWSFDRSADPYAGARREPGFENLWWAKIPGTADNMGRVATCSYFINETDNTVRCATFAVRPAATAPRSAPRSTRSSTTTGHAASSPCS